MYIIDPNFLSRKEQQSKIKNNVSVACKKINTRSKCIQTINATYTCSFLDKYTFF